MKKALITGITGQDGPYLARFLLSKNYEVYGAFRRSAQHRSANLQALGIQDDVRLVSMDLLEFTNVLRVVDKVAPDEIYNLAAQSFVATSFEQPVFTADVTGLGALRLLEVIMAVNPAIRFYQASSSEMFGMAPVSPQNESTPFQPRNPYGVSKLFAHWMAVTYRLSYNLFACCGILFNHESPLRGLDFVTRKITRSVAELKLGSEKEIRLGNLHAYRDWGYAPEYVEAMWLMLQQPEPHDFVIATGETHTVGEFVECALNEIGIDIEWNGDNVEEVGIDTRTGKCVVRVDRDLVRPTEIDRLVGDASLARQKLGWASRTTFRELVEVMVQNDLKLVKAEGLLR